MSNVVLGYHGTRRTVVRAILAGGPFELSRNAYDWLGDGVYFWEYGPVRAYEWAVQEYGNEAVVLRARVRLHRCLNLTDLKGTRDLKRAYRVVLSRAASSDIRLPRQRGGYRALDREVINFLAEMVKPSVGVVRGAFIEGERLWEESGFWEMSHVQVAVRDLGLISNIEVVEDV